MRNCVDTWAPIASLNLHLYDSCVGSWIIISQISLYSGISISNLGSVKRCSGKVFVWHINTGNQCNIATTGAASMTFQSCSCIISSEVSVAFGQQSVFNLLRRSIRGLWWHQGKFLFFKKRKHNSSVSIRLRKPACTKDMVQIWWKDNVRCSGWI